MAQMEMREVILIVIAIVTLANTVILSLLKMGFNKFSQEMSELWEAIRVMRDKQSALREELPKEYLRIEGEGYKALMESLNRIETHFEKFTQDCREGKCGGLSRAKKVKAA